MANLTSTSDLINDTDITSQLGAASNDYTNVHAQLGVTLTRFGADPTGKNDCREIFQQALDYAATTNHKTVWIDGTFLITGEISLKVPVGVNVRGYRTGRTQGVMTSGLNAALEPSVLLVRTKPGTDVTPGTNLFECTISPSFDGFVVYYDQQPKNITDPSLLLKYGYTFYTVGRSCSVTNVLYAGAWNFFWQRGESPFCQNIYGFAYGTDFHVEKCADVGVFDNIHSNPNVIRPAFSTITAAAKLATSIMFDFSEHDGMMLSNIHGFGKGVVFNNDQKGTVRLMSLVGNNFLFDKCGTLINSNASGARIVDFTGGTFIHDYAQLSGMLVLKNTTQTQLSQYYLNGWKFQLGSPLEGDATDIFFYFGDSAGCSLILNEVVIPSKGTLKLNNILQSNIINGDITIGSRRISLNRTYNNLVTNSRLLSVDLNTNMPVDFQKSGANTSIKGREVTSSYATVDDNSIAGLLKRVLDVNYNGPMSVVVYATAIGDSPGVKLNATDDNFDENTKISQFTKWSLEGPYYVARLSTTSTALYSIWDICCLAPSKDSGVLRVHSVELIPSSVFSYSSEVEEPPLLKSQVGSITTTMDLPANTATMVKRSIWGATNGIMRVYLKSATTLAIFTLYKATESSQVTVIQDIYNQSDSDILNVTWPSNGRLTISSSAGGSVRIRIDGV
ncbi:hypothetical protein [Serratia quinivorans]|uniref:hypothetical protein n=1 Tax=Serratia quinivorans TaxID=137545 RepID=UPI002178D223|nr:hypothetical protein [Serratia quinivorans]CAI0825007.1 Pectate lyase superfamily protein [Serratia quinivorans]CAI1659545.1 Pectate lyase superfamily protein [Serratia quinivorans]